jgi:glycerol kinase
LQLGDYTIPFTASARDQGASLFARGLPEPDACYINIGTGAFIQRLSENLHAPEGLLVSPLWLPKNGLPENELPENPAAKKYYAWEATVNGAAAAISFIQQHAGLTITPQKIDSALELNPAGDCYFLNAVGGLSAPYWRTDLQSRFSENLSAAEKILAWIESVIFQIVINVQLMNQLGDTQKIIISGGFSKADTVCQKIADLTNATVHRSDNPDATVQGIACMAAGLPESWKPALMEDIFTPQQNPVLQQRFANWQRKMNEWLQN